MSYIEDLSPENWVHLFVCVESMSINKPYSRRRKDLLPKVMTPSRTLWSHGHTSFLDFWITGNRLYSVSKTFPEFQGAVQAVTK